MKGPIQIRIATYNVHKCKGMDRRVDPARVAEVVSSLDADVVGLQEVLDVRDGHDKHNQARIIADRLQGYEWCFGENRDLLGGSYGNMILSKFPITAFTNYDLTHRGRERRGCLRADLVLEPGRIVHMFNVHLGTGYMERRHQARRFVSLLDEEPLEGPRVILGDFNEWTRGLASRGLAENFETFQPRKALGQSRTYPGLVPLLHLDHFYYDRELQLERMRLVRTRTTLMASDHLPLLATFMLRV